MEEKEGKGKMGKGGEERRRVGEGAQQGERRESFAKLRLATLSLHSSRPAGTHEVRSLVGLHARCRPGKAAPKKRRIARQAPAWLLPSLRGCVPSMYTGGCPLYV